MRNLSLRIRSCQDDNATLARLADVQAQVGRVEERTKTVGEQVHALQDRLLREEEAATALTRFDPVWETLTPADQARVVGLLVERVDYDGSQGKLSISFHLTGIKALADELFGRAQERAYEPTRLRLDEHEPCQSARRLFHL